MTSPLSEVLIRLASAAGRASTVDELCQAALAGVRDATGISRAAILLFDSEGVMRFRAWNGISDAYRAVVEGHSPWAHGATAPEPIVAADVAREPSLAAFRGAFARDGIASLAFVPIVSRGETIGKLMLYRDEPYPFTAEIRAALTIGYQIGFAVERARALREEATLRERLTFVTEASHRLLTSLDVDAVVGEIVTLAQRAISADAYAVWRRESRQWRVAASRHLSGGFTAQVVVENQTTNFSAPIVAEDVLQTSVLDARRGAYAAEGVQSLVSIPLEERGRPVGSIAFYYRRRHRPSELELRVAVALGHLAAAAMSNARLFTEAQAANRLKDEFLATLSHELRTPLNVILGRARMLAAVPSDAPVRQSVETIERNAQLLARLVDDLLDVSRITLGQIRLDLQPASLATIIDTVVASVEPTARARGVLLIVEPHEPVAPLLIDTARLQQVLWNLLTNAIKFTPTAGRVTVSLRQGEGQAVLTVSDTGRGIAREFLPHVFDMFRQAEPATTRHFGGLGLGLSIVRRLVELHGGFVKAESAGLDQGTTFTVCLPVPGASGASPVGARAAEVS